MKFFPADWRADLGLRTTSLAARGLWIEMLTIMHEAAPRGSLSLNGRQLTVRDLALLTAAAQTDVAAALDELTAAGVFSTDSDGTIFSRRMRRDDAKAAQLRAIGSKGGNPFLKRRANKWDNPWVNPPVSPPDNPSVNGSDKAQKPEARGQKPEARRQKQEHRTEVEEPLASLANRARECDEFIRFWNAWPHKVGRRAAEKAFAKVSREIDAILKGLAAYIRDKPPDRQWLNPATFLNQRRWEDAPAPSNARASPSRGRYSGDPYINALMESQVDDDAAKDAQLDRDYDLDLTANPSS
jgi:hypothetical protein